MKLQRNGFGTRPERGEPRDGPTLLPTWWFGDIPSAIPIDGWNAQSLAEAEILAVENLKSVISS
jgi:hypothetical protein